jgi:hypothetical protein
VCFCQPVAATISANVDMRPIPRPFLFLMDDKVCYRLALLPAGHMAKNAQSVYWAFQTRPTVCCE